MDDLLKRISNDMGITPYLNETDESFTNRTILSALGVWCLMIGQECTQDHEGISKNKQTIILNNVLNSYLETYPIAAKYFVSKNDIAIFIRRFYEQTGYLLTDDNNYNELNKGRETIWLNDRDYLFFGLPSTNYHTNGFGIHIDKFENEVDISEFLVRDNLSSIEYVNANYNICDFEEREININDWEFYNPFSKELFSKSWNNNVSSVFTVARKDKYGPYYKVIKSNDSFFFSVENNNDSDFMTGCEYWRLYSTLRHYYHNPMFALFCPIDETYTHVLIKGMIPNREYYFILLNGWPKKQFSDKYNFIIKNDAVFQIKLLLQKLGFITKDGDFYG